MFDTQTGHYVRSVATYGNEMNLNSPTLVNSPFLTIPPIWRKLIIVYMVLYHIIFPIISALYTPDADLLLVPRFILHATNVLLVCLPLFFYRPHYGFLHPLIIPIIYSIFSTFAKVPLHAVLPLTFPLASYEVSTNSIAISLKIGNEELALIRLWYEAIQSLALISYYLGYFAFNIFKVPTIKFHPPRNLSVICFGGVAFCFIVGMVFIELTSGGLANHLVAMRSGRAALFEGLGPILMIGEFSIIIILVWFNYAERPFGNPYWLAALSMAGFITLVIAGSRSSLIYAMVVLLLLWWKKRNRVIVLPSIAMAIFALLIFSIFGSIRQDWESRDINSTVFSLSNFSENMDRAKIEFEKRSDEEGALAAFAGADEGLLWGRSYLASAAFWIPRAIWSDKPHGAGAYNMWVNFAGRPLEQFGTGIYWGIPLSPEAEAYWNFHIPGVVFIFGLYGAFHRWLAGFVLQHAYAPIALIFSTWIGINFVGDSQSFLRTMQDIILLVLFCYALGILRISRYRNFRVATVRQSMSEN